MLYLDFETYNELDIRLVGLHRYTETCEILLVAYAMGDAPVRIVDVVADGFPAELLTLLTTDITVCGHNSQFERMVVKHALGIATKVENYYCSMALALSLGLPGALGALGNAVGLSEETQKLKDGKKLIQRFCSPAPKNHKTDRYSKDTHPEEWARFMEYCRQDVETMRHIVKLLPKWNYSGSELDLYHLDQKINERGFKVDLSLAHAAIRATEKKQTKLADEITVATLGKVTKATQREKLLNHLNDEHGAGLEDMTKGTIADALADPNLSDEVRVIMEIRRQASKTSAAKYNKVISCVTPDGRLKGTLQFNGASRTRRWAGRIVQPQNLPQPSLSIEEIDAGIAAMKADCEDLVFDDIMGLASSAIRGVIIAPEERKLVVSDLSNIEGRVNAWLSNEDWKIKEYAAFDRGEVEDLYNLAYSSYFGVPVSKVTKDQRKVGKVIELAYGYEGGVGATVNMAKVYRVDLGYLASVVLPNAPEWAVKEATDFWAWMSKKGNTHDLPRNVFIGCDTVKRMWRVKNPKITRMWKKLKNAAIGAIRTPDTTFHVEKLSLRSTKQWLLIRLPSGRVLCYYHPKVTDDGKISFWGTDSVTKTWGKKYTYGGSLIENACQSLSRDIMAHGMQPAENAGYETILTVHDEIIAETPDTPEFSAEGLSKILATNPPWADGLPLAASGFETYRYRKE